MIFKCRFFCWQRLAGFAVLISCATVFAEPHHHGEKTVAAKPAGCADSARISVHCGLVPSAKYAGKKLWVTFVQNQFVWVSHSNDNGKNFSTPVKVNNTPQEIYSNGENRPKIHVRGKHIYISWTEKTEGHYTGDIRFARSTDKGKSFSPSIKVNDDGLLTSHRFDAMHVTDEGRIYLAWLDKRNKEAAQKQGGEYPGSAVYFAVSDNSGESFSKNKKVADNSCECCRIAMDDAGKFVAEKSATDKSEAVIFWRQIFDGGMRDHALMTLGPNGATSGLYRATIDDWKIDACPHHGPDVAASPARAGYHLAWFSDGAKNQGLYYGFFTGEESVTAVQMDSDAGASHPQVFAAKEILYYAWKIFDGKKTVVKLKTSKNQGKSWSDAGVIAGTTGGSDHPLLFASPGGEAVLSWHTDKEGLRIIQLGEHNAA